MEQGESLGRRRLRRLAVENATEPVDMDQLVVLRQAFDREFRVGRPRWPASGEHSNAFDLELREAGVHGCDVLGRRAIHDDVTARCEALRQEEAIDLRRVDAADPRCGECDGTGDVAPTRLAVEPPAVVGGERPDIDDREVRVMETVAELGGGDRGGFRCGNDFEGTHRNCVPSLDDGAGRGHQKTPVDAGVPGKPARDRVDRALSYTVGPAGQRRNTNTEVDGPSSDALAGSLS